LILISMLVLFGIFLLIGMPMGFAMGLSAVLPLWYQGQVPLIQLPLRFFSGLDSFALMAVLLFILAGNLMNVGGITERIIAFARSLVGHLRGGLAQVNILTSVMFGTVNGAAMADTAAVGSMMIPSMAKEGYDRRFSVVVTAASSLIGPILPPSITAIIYATLTGVSIGKMFLAGIIPGLMVGGAMMALTWFLSPRYGWKPVGRASLRAVGSTFIGASPAIVMPVIIVGGIVSGVFTPTEAGAVAVLYGLVMAIISRRMNVRQFFEFTLESAKLTASALVILGGAGLFGWVLTREGFGFMIEDALLSISTDPVIVMLLILVALFIIGWFVEGTAAMIITVPTIAPIATGLGYDPLQFGMAMILMLLVGAVTPPVGVVALLACKIGKVEYASTFRLLYAYCAVVIFVVLCVAFVPSLTLWLPNVLMN